MMSDENLRDLRVLVVEDDYMIATDLMEQLQDAGAEVIGPVASVKAALLVIESGEHLDGALLDVNLKGERVYPVADALIAKGVPFIFSTGYDERLVPADYRDIPRCEKPVDTAVLTHTLGAHVQHRKNDEVH
jgi:CheY-like chemotaxis protein